MNPDPTNYGSPPPPGQQPPRPYEETVAANPNQNNNPYNPYGTPPPATPGQQGGNPYDPYSPYGPQGGNPYPYQQGNTPAPPASPYPQYPGAPTPSNPNLPPGAQYQYPNQYPNALPQYNQQYGQPGTMGAPTGGRSSSGKTLLIILAVLVVLGGLTAAIAIPIYNNQVATSNKNATATASARSGTATAQQQATATAQVYATATAVASTYPFSANLKFDDPLTSENKAHGWVVDKRCTFTSDGYKAEEPNTKTYYTCPAMKTNFTDFTYQISMRINKGDYAGITFRGDDLQSKAYSFYIAEDGAFGLLLYSQKGVKPRTLYSSSTSYYNAGQVNTLGVTARGSKIALYVNKHEVATLTDSTLPNGQIGTIVYDITNPVEAIFTDAKVWQL
jgi:Tfp pilus assembly protein PilE